MKSSTENTQTNFCHLVDPFLGCEPADLPDPSGIVRSWWTAKPPIGNTHPGASLPFGMVSVGAYSGAYVTGYGRYELSLSGDQPEPIHDRNLCLGFTHFQQSGTGRIRVYYNYLLTRPLVDQDLEKRLTTEELTDESAAPGRYRATLKESEIHCSVVAAERGVKHRYDFPESSKSPCVLVNASSAGLLLDTMTSYPQGAELKIESPSRVSGTLLMEGVPIHFVCECPGGEAKLWEEDEWLEGEDTFTLGIDKQKIQPEFGFGFVGSQSTMELNFAFSLQELTRAGEATSNLAAIAHEKLACQAESTWNEALSKIQISGGTEAQREVFYTALYHSFLKPADFKGENPFRKSDGPFFFDLSTLWDLYKTQLPLMMTLWPERAADFVEFLREVATREGGFPISYLMDNTPDRFTKQATGLCHIILEDARLRGIKGDWDAILHLLWKTSQSGKGRRGKFGEYAKNKVVDPLSHTLDIAQAHASIARMARALGIQIIHDQASELSTHWPNAFDSETGLLKQDSTYYEGENWNYSFRLLHDMAGRISQAGGKSRFVELLDLFFGFKKPIPGQRVFHFEGLNNEPDMESPYAYLYAGRHDRTAEIVQATMRQRFALGRGGLPGNDDSGGLSSWFVWNACGLFPVAGQPVMLIGSPLFAKAEFQLKGGSFTVIAPDPDASRPYIASATLNGQPIDRAWLHLSEFEPGAQLELVRSSIATDFGKSHLPPSFPC